MSPILLGTFEPNTPDWYALRADGIGSSDIAAIVGDSTWGSPFSVWVDKTATDLPAEGPNHLYEWGHRMEPLIARKFADEHPEFSVETTGTWHADGRPWQRANPDRLLRLGDEGDVVALLEIKNSQTAKQWEDGVPEKYMAQIHWQADVMDVHVVYVAVLIGGNDYREFRVDIDPFNVSRLRSIGQTFWEENVLGFKQPGLDGLDATLQAVWRVTPPPIDAEVPVDTALATRWFAAKRALDQAEADYAQMKSEMLLTMGDAKRAIYAGEVIARRKSYGRKGIRASDLKEKYPDIYAELLYETPVNSIEAVTPKETP